MKEKPYRIFYCGDDRSEFDVLVPNYFANYKYVKIKGINAGIDTYENLPNNIGLFCDEHSYNATYGDGICFLNLREDFNYFMFNVTPLLNGSKSVCTYLPYRNKYRFYFKNLSADPTATEMTLIFELEPVNFN